MKRKKFVKQLMSRRLSRNVAEALADKARRHGIPYFVALGDFLNLCWMRTHNALWDNEVWQTAEANVWVEVLANE